MATIIIWDQPNNPPFIISLGKTQDHVRSRLGTLFVVVGELSTTTCSFLSMSVFHRKNPHFSTGKNIFLNSTKILFPSKKKPELTLARR
ncbi:hypothetical protein BVX98_07750 [bacterium F11]|nr:hypothetical protein BVX98_07750 [bacterium F11]